MKKTHTFLINTALILCLLTATAQATFAQQPLRNTAFKDGEKLSYALYFNWKFIWFKVGSAELKTNASSYQGKPSYCASLTTRTSSKYDKYFCMRDTILCHTTQDLIPLYFRKGAREGSRYYVDDMRYTYSGGACTVNLSALHDNGTHSSRSVTAKENIYDMLSIFLRARSFNASKWKEGHSVPFSIAGSTSVTPARIKLRKRSVVKDENKNKYRCLELSYLELEGGKYKEIVRFYVTDDANHLPIRLDLFLRFGSAKAFLTSYKGLRSPLTSLQEK